MATDEPEETHAKFMERMTARAVKLGIGQAAQEARQKEQLSSQRPSKRANDPDAPVPDRPNGWRAFKARPIRCTDTDEVYATIALAAASVEGSYSGLVYALKHAKGEAHIASYKGRKFIAVEDDPQEPNEQ